MTVKKIAGQSSWTFRTAKIEAAVTQTGGHLGPVRFRLGQQWVQPFDIAPWAEEKLPAGAPPIEQVLRGDFFCMPFGGNGKAFRGEKFPPHGEPANAAWKLEAATPDALHLSLKTKIRPGRVDKIIWLGAGETAVYLQHTLSGMKGPMSLGHHAILRVPEGAAGRVSVSPFRFGQVYPGVLERPELGGYSILKPGAKFSSLNRVAQTDGKFADLSHYPARDGFEDIILLASKAGSRLAWTALTVPEKNYVWFALKNPRVLPSTLFWMSNGGRHYPPWNGRHRRAIGLEEVISHFHEGIAESVKPNGLTRAGIPTCLQLQPKRPTVINYIMALAEIPRGFDIVKSIRVAADKRSVRLVSQSGRVVPVKVNVEFLSAPALV